MYNYTLLFMNFVNAVTMRSDFDRPNVARKFNELEITQQFFSSCGSQQTAAILQSIFFFMNLLFFHPNDVYFSLNEEEDKEKLIQIDLNLWKNSSKSMKS